MVSPLAGAGPERVTVPVELAPPATLAGETVSTDRATGLTLRVALALLVPYEAVIATAVVLATGTVVATNVTELPPGATVTVEGTITVEGSALDSCKVAPLAPVGPFRVTVPVDVAPPPTVAGLSETPDTRRGLTVRSAPTVVVPSLTERVALPVEVTGTVDTLKVAEVAPPATVTPPGADASEGSLIEIDRGVPPAGAAAESVTVATTELPPTAVAGKSAMPAGMGGVTVSEVVCTVELSVPVTTTAVGAATVRVVTAKLALVVPAGTVTDAGTAATAVLLLESPTATPPVGAGEERTTVPVTGVPAAAVVGETEIESPRGTAGVTVMNWEVRPVPPRPSEMSAVMVNRVVWVTAGGVNTAEAPVPLTLPPSDDQR